MGFALSGVLPVIKSLGPEKCHNSDISLSRVGEIARRVMLFRRRVEKSHFAEEGAYPGSGFKP